MNNYRNIDADFAAVAYCDAQERDNADWSSSQLMAIDERMKEAKVDFKEYGFMFFDGGRISVESIIADFDEEFINTWVHENFIFTCSNELTQADMYRTMRDAIIGRAIDALQHDLEKNKGHKYFYDIVGED